MKRLFFLLTVILLSGQAFSQQLDGVRKLTQQDYLEKSERQSNAAWCLAGGGAVFITIGAVIPKGEFHSSGDWWEDLWGGGHYENDGIRATFIGLGYLSALGSIPCFLAAGRNKRKAASLSLHNEPVQVIKGGRFAQQRIPALQLKIRI